MKQKNPTILMNKDMYVLNKDMYVLKLGFYKRELRKFIILHIYFGQM